MDIDSHTHVDPVKGVKLSLTMPNARRVTNRRNVRHASFILVSLFGPVGVDEVGGDGGDGGVGSVGTTSVCATDSYTPN